MKPFPWILMILIGFIACKPQNESFKIFTVGDSTMANKNPEVYPETGWCQVIDLFFDESVQIRNHAVNGRSSKSFLDEGRWKAVYDSLKSGDYVFIQFGHNDQKDYDSSRYTNPFGSYSANLKRFIIDTREKGAFPILITPVVRRKFGENHKLIDTHGDYPRAMKQVAKEMNVPLVDLQKITEEWINTLGDDASKEMYIWSEPNEKYPEGRQDDTHLSEKGATMVAQKMLDESHNMKLNFTNRLKMYQ